ncbi:hypothetical protein HYZ80_03640 [Candidatus Parcubacteria bacterium]|nr:hypothetical protein [Candidatus Parcubacteria bacterium]
MQLRHINKTDPKVAKLVAAEVKRRRATINLIPSENLASASVLM